MYTKSVSVTVTTVAGKV
jgi:hypothetical protein